MSDTTARDTFALELRRIMSRKDISPTRLSAQLYLSKVTLHKYLNGSRLPTREMFDSLAAAVAEDAKEGIRLTFLYERAAEELRRTQWTFPERSQGIQPVPGVAGMGILPSGSTVAGATPFHGRATTGTRLRTPSGPAPDPILYSTAADFVAGLNSVHLWAMEPSLRDLERRSLAVTGRRCPRSTLSNMLNSTTLPRWDLALAFLELCGVRDTETWGFVWRRIRAAERTARLAG